MSIQIFIVCECMGVLEERKKMIYNGAYAMPHIYLRRLNAKNVLLDQ